MANYKFTFEEITQYAERLGYEHRGEPSKAKDYTQTYWWNPFNCCEVMVLYEGKKRTLRGHREPEVCWICVLEDGSIASIPSRYFRKYYEQLPGFTLTIKGKQKLADYIYKGVILI